jgi:hypothetical protein
MQASHSKALYILVHHVCHKLWDKIGVGIPIILFIKTSQKSWNPVSLLMLLSYGFVDFIGGTMTTLNKLVAQIHQKDNSSLILYIWFQPFLCKLLVLDLSSFVGETHTCFLFAKNPYPLLCSKMAKICNIFYIRENANIPLME